MKRNNYADKSTWPSTSQTMCIAHTKWTHALNCIACESRLGSPCTHHLCGFRLRAYMHIVLGTLFYRIDAYRDHLQERIISTQKHRTYNKNRSEIKCNFFLIYRRCSNANIKGLNCAHVDTYESISDGGRYHFNEYIEDRSCHFVEVA